METNQSLKYCLYARKSSESDERQAMSIDSQLNEMREMAKREDLNVVIELQESFSAKESGKRPVYNQLLKGLRDGEYNAVLTWAPDRLSRNAGDLGSIVDLMDQGKLLHIRTYSQMFSNNPNEKFLLMILCSQAKLENDNKSINVKRGIKTKCEMGWRPGVAPLGYINRAFGGVKDIMPDPDRADVIKQVFERTAQGWSGRRVLSWLDEVGLTNRSGQGVTLSQVFLILNNPFYYGEFEYPEGSGKWFKGAHKPLITKELFSQVQNGRVIYKGQWGSKTFAFKGILKCGNCGAEITAEEKFKLLNDGSHKRYVYYHCTKQIDYSCNEKYVNETDITEKLIEYFKQHGKDIKTSSDIRRRVARHQELVLYHLQKHGVDTSKLEPFAEYAEFILNKGSYTQKGELIAGIETKFVLRNKEIQVA